MLADHRPDEFTGRVRPQHQAVKSASVFGGSGFPEGSLRLWLAVVLAMLGGWGSPGVGLFPERAGIPYAHAATVEIYYGPEDRPGHKMVELYDRAEQYIYVAMYGITYRKAVTALVSAKKRGVDVRVISDRGRLDDRNQMVALQTLHRAGIPIRLNTHDNLMHLKQVVIDDRVNTSGSMNLSHSGHRYNDERLNVIIDSKTSIKARKKFLSMWNNHSRYEKWP